MNSVHFPGTQHAPSWTINDYYPTHCNTDQTWLWCAFKYSSSVRNRYCAMHVVAYVGEKNVTNKEDLQLFCHKTAFLLCYQYV